MSATALSPAPGADSDEALARRLALGDARALELLHRRHAGALLTLATRLLGERAEAEEVVQEAFLEAWRKASRFEAERGAPGAWLSIIVRSRALDRLRAHAARARAHAASADASTTGDSAPGDEAETARDVERLRGALAALPAEQRRMLELSHFQGLSHADIAQLTGLPLGTVKTRLRTARLRLGRAL